MSTLETKKRLLLSKWRCDLDDARDKIDELQEQIDAHDDEVVDLIEALEQVRYWLLDGLAHHKLVSDPRALLRKVEDVL
jgi:hypothetical protein